MIEQELFALIDQRMRNRQGESLPVFLARTRPHRSNLAAQARWVFANRNKVTSFFEDESLVRALVSHSIEQVKDFVYSRNQFLDLDRTARATLRMEYSWFFAHVKDELAQAQSADDYSERLERLTLTHLANLSIGLRKTIKSVEHRDAFLMDVPCGEYSPANQISILHLSQPLMEPVLDVGCGSQANLVRHLYAAGVEVLGIDRSAPAVPFCQTCSWDDFDYGPACWGTIIAHQSFSTHFIFNHQHSQSGAQQMASTLMHILQGLKPGGRLVYTPGLPFIEPYLARKDGFQVKRHAITGMPTELASIGYACHVVREE